MTRRKTSATQFALALVALACGDVTSDLITGSSAGSSGSSSGGSSGSAGGGAGGAGGSAGSSAGGSAGSSAGGSSSGSGGTPECTNDDECTDSERDTCDVMRGRCVECLDEGWCDIEEACNVEVGECGRTCMTAEECIEPDDPVCANGFCVECQGDDDCPGGQQCANFQCSD